MSQRHRLVEEVRAKLNVVGMTETDANAALKAHGVPVRVLQRGDSFIFGADDKHRPSRCNLYLDAAGRVIRAMHDGGHGIAFPNTDFCNRVYLGLRNPFDPEESAEWREVDEATYAAKMQQRGTRQQQQQPQLLPQDDLLCTALARSGLSRLVGMTETDAVALLRAHNVPVRVLQRGIQRFHVHDDFHPYRCNIIVDMDGRVSSVTGDGGRAFMDLDACERLFLKEDSGCGAALLLTSQLIGWAERDATARLSELGATYQVCRISHHPPSRVDEYRGVTLYVKEGWVLQARSSYDDNRLLPAEAVAVAVAMTTEEVGGSSSESAAAARPSTTTAKLSDLDSLVGMSEADATRVLESCGAVTRVTQRGEEHYIGTQNIRPDRCNLRVGADGRVVSAMHDLGAAFPDAAFRKKAIQRSEEMAEWKREIARIGGSKEQQQAYLTRMIKHFDAYH